MEHAELTESRLSVLEARMAALEQRLATLEQGTTTTPKRRKRELSPEDRAAIRARLVAGQQAKKEREAAAAAEAKKPTKQKGDKNGTPTAEN